MLCAVLLLFVTSLICTMWNYILNDNFNTNSIQNLIVGLLILLVHVSVHQMSHSIILKRLIFLLVIRCKNVKYITYYRYLFSWRMITTPCGIKTGLDNIKLKNFISSLNFVDLWIHCIVILVLTSRSRWVRWDCN